MSNARKTRAKKKQSKPDWTDEEFNSMYDKLVAAYCVAEKGLPGEVILAVLSGHLSDVADEYGDLEKITLSCIEVLAKAAIT